MGINEQIKPFQFIPADPLDAGTRPQAFLHADDFLQDLFDERAAEGNGYDWTALAQVYLAERCSEELQSLIEFEPEAEVFSVFSDDEEALRNFMLGFKAACDNREVITELLSRAVLD